MWYDVLQGIDNIFLLCLRQRCRRAIKALKMLLLLDGFLGHWNRLDTEYVDSARFCKSTTLTSGSSQSILSNSTTGSFSQFVPPSSYSDKCLKRGSLACSIKTSHCAGRLKCCSISRMTPALFSVFTAVPSHPTTVRFWTFVPLTCTQSVTFCLVLQAMPLRGVTWSK